MVPSLYFIKVHLTQYHGEILQVGSMRLRVARLAYGQCSVTVARLSVLSAWEFALETDQISLISVMGGGKAKDCLILVMLRQKRTPLERGKATAWKCLSLWSRNNNHLRALDFGFNWKWLPLPEFSLTNHNAFLQSHPKYTHASGSKGRDANVASCLNWLRDNTQ